jgi:hypothetical protein
MFNVSVVLQTLKTNSRSHTPLRPQTPAPTSTRPHFTKSAPPHTNQPVHANSAAALCCLICVGPAASFASSALLPLFCCTAPLSFLVLRFHRLSFLLVLFVCLVQPKRHFVSLASSCLYFLWFSIVLFLPFSVLWFCRVLPFTTKCKQMRLVCAFIVGVL